MNGVVFSKTVFGIDELQQRQMRLHPRLRSLLVLVDGKRTASQLLQTLSATGVGLEHLQELQDAGLIQPVPKSAASAPSSENTKPSQADPLTVLPAEVPKDESSRMMSLFRIYGEVIPATFGARAAPYLKKLDQARSIADYFVLGNEVITALNKTARIEEAVIFKTRVKPYLR